MVIADLGELGWAKMNKLLKNERDDVSGWMPATKQVGGRERWRREKLHFELNCVLHVLHWPFGVKLVRGRGADGPQQRKSFAY